MKKLSVLVLSVACLAAASFATLSTNTKNIKKEVKKEKAKKEVKKECRHLCPFS
jgi:hypothetical protein